MLVVVYPLAIIGGAFRVDESAMTICHAIEPLSLIDTAIRLNHATQPLHLIVDELTLILGPVWPNQYTQAVLHFPSCLELPIVHQTSRSETTQRQDLTYHCPWYFLGTPSASMVSSKVQQMYRF